VNFNQVIGRYRRRLSVAAQLGPGFAIAQEMFNFVGR
jgi:hypothetical protein